VWLWSAVFVGRFQSKLFPKFDDLVSDIVVRFVLNFPVVHFLERVVRNFVFRQNRDLDGYAVVKNQHNVFHFQLMSVVLTLSVSWKPLHLLQLRGFWRWVQRSYKHCREPRGIFAVQPR